MSKEKKELLKKFKSIIEDVMDHYEAYDDNGNFICSGDTLNEAVSEAEKCLVERR